MDGTRVLHSRQKVVYATACMHCINFFRRLHGIPSTRLALTHSMEGVGCWFGCTRGFILATARHAVLPKRTGTALQTQSMSRRVHTLASSWCCHVLVGSDHSPSNLVLQSLDPHAMEKSKYSSTHQLSLMGKLSSSSS